MPPAGAGPDPNRIFIGSEGIFGIVVEACIRILKIPNEKNTEKVKKNY